MDSAPAVNNSAELRRLTIQTPDAIAEALLEGKLNAFQNADGLARCLIRFLTALDWRGNPRHLAEALPHFVTHLDIIDLRNILGHLDFQTQYTETRIADIDPRLFPCFFVTKSGSPLVILGKESNHTYNAFDGIADKETVIDGRRIDGTAYFTSQQETTSEALTDNSSTWFRSMTKRFQKLVISLFAITFVLDLLAMIIPIFTMVVYDKVIGQNAYNLLVSLCIGLAVVFVADMGLRFLRTRTIAHIGGRIDYLIGTATLRQLLYLPPAFTETAPIGAQISRIREFESIREFFTGPLAAAVLELPFVAIFLLVIAIIAGPIALIPFVLILVFIVFGALIQINLTQYNAVSGEARSNRHRFVVEMLANLRAIKQMGAEKVWAERYRNMSAKTVLSQFKSQQVSFLLQTSSQILMMIAGVATLTWGTLRILEGDMTVGAMIATMALVWRILSPLQMVYTTMTRFEQIRAGVTMINQLMSLRPERNPHHSVRVARTFAGHISFQRVSARYRGDSDPVLLGCSFDIEPGECVAVTGANGAGKSTILKMILGLYRPQGGTVLIDGIDIRQIDPIELRHSVDYSSQNLQFFHGTISQNLRMTDPTATDEALIAAVKSAGVLDEINSLPEKFETRIGDQRLNQLSTGFLQRLSLARAYLKDSPILLLDEPGQSLDFEADQHLMDHIKSIKGTKTIVIVTHRPSYMRIADRVMLLHAGQIAMSGPADVVLERVPREFT